VLKTGDIYICLLLLLLIIIIIIIIVVVVVVVISFMQGIHTHIPETNHVPRGYIVAAIPSLFIIIIIIIPLKDERV
jgi:hypothetical protein